MDYTGIQEFSSTRTAGRPSDETLKQANTERRVLLVSSAGGHLAQLLLLEPWLKNHDRRWVTFDLADSRSKLKDEWVYPAAYPTTRNIPNLLKNFRLAWQVLRSYKPDVIVSSGAGVAIPFFLLGKLTGTKTVYLEVYDRVTSRTMTGRICRPLASLFCLQWPEQQRQYGSGVVVGPVY